MARNGYHLSLSLSRELWADLLHAALPVTLTEGEFDLAHQAREGLRQLGVRQRVAGLLEDRRPPELIVRAGDRARRAWRSRKPAVYKRFAEVLRVEGTFRVELDEVGSQFRYADQAVGADAFVKGVVEGTIFVLRENVEIPFTLEKRVGASVTLGDIRFDRGQQAIIGSLQDLALHLGDGAVLELVGRLGEYLLEQQLPKVNPVPILKRGQVDEMVGGLGGSLRMKMAVESMELDVSEDDLTLSVKFGFAHRQLEEKGAGDVPGGRSRDPLDDY